jgi:hypothetical protein
MGNERVRHPKSFVGITLNKNLLMPWSFFENPHGSHCQISIILLLQNARPVRDDNDGRCGGFIGDDVDQEATAA